MRDKLPKISDELSLSRRVWKEASFPILLLATIVSVSLLIFYFSTLTIYKYRGLKEKTVIMAETLQKAIEVSDWDLVLQNMTASISTGGLSQVALTTNSGDIVTGPLRSIEIQFFPICKTQKLNSPPNLSLHTCATLVGFSEFVIFVFVLIFLLGLSLLCKQLVSTSSKKIIDSISEQINFMHNIIDGSAGEAAHSKAFTETKGLVDQIQSLLRKAEVNQFERARADLAAQVVHDIRSPVSALKIGISQIHEEKSKDAAALINLAISKIETLCEELLKSYRKSTNTPKSPGGHDLSECGNAIKQAVEEKIRKLSNTKYINIVYKHDFVSTQIGLSPLSMQRIVDNLIENSIYAVPDNGSITVELYRSEGSAHAQLYVTDNGCGISEEDLPHIFNKAFTKNKTNGTGLGLYSVHKQVSDAGGSIKVFSKIGVGTRFEIILPAHETMQS